MADTTEKPKEKKKKKSTGSSKEKDKKNVDGSATTSITTDDLKQIEQLNKDEQQNQQDLLKTKDGNSTEQSQPSKKGKDDSVEFTTETSANDSTSIKREQEEVEIIPSDISDQPLVRPEYVAPAPATKKDVNLLNDLDEAKLEELKEAFHLFDLNRDGFIDKEDLKLTFVSLGQTDMSDNQIMQMLSEAVNPLDFESFVILLGYKTIEMDPEAILIEALSRWDYDNSGLISEDRIKHDLMTWGDKFTPQEADMALDDAPMCVVKGNTMIDYIKFCNTLSGLRKKTKTPGPEDFMSEA